MLIAQVALSISGLQHHLVDWLSAPSRALPADLEPDYLVLLGGGAMPSEDTLMRIYWAAEALGRYRGSDLEAIVASATSAAAIRDELVLRGFPAERIRLETEGRDTYQQAIGVQRLLGPSALGRRIVIVTDRQHRRRSALIFDHLRFEQVYVYDGEWGSNQVPAKRRFNQYLRYGFWSDLASQPWLVRECVALVAYRVRDRI